MVPFLLPEAGTKYTGLESAEIETHSFYLALTNEILTIDLTSLL